MTERQSHMEGDYRRQKQRKRERAREIHQDKTQRHALTNPNIDLEEDRQ